METVHGRAPPHNRRSKFQLQRACWDEDSSFLCSGER
jgi:hypothetical protein